jgi:hypothetical protein
VTPGRKPRKPRNVADRRQWRRQQGQRRALQRQVLAAARAHQDAAPFGLQIATIDALDRWRAELPENYDPPFPDHHVEWAIRVVQSVPVVGEVDSWMAQAYKGPGGRPRELSVEALFVGLILAAEAGKGLAFRLIHKALYHRLSPAMRDKLGVGPEPVTPDQDDAAYQRVRRLFWQVVALMDPSPLPKNRVLKKEELELATRPMTGSEIAEAYRRLDLVTNWILEASFNQLPRWLRRRWNGSIGLDATPVAANARGTGPNSIYASCDPQAAWYARDGDHRDPSSLPDARAGKGRKRRDPFGKIIWGYEATFATMGPDKPERDRYFPRLIIAMVCHRPGFDPDVNALRVLRSIRDRGHPAGLLGADRLYLPDCKPEEFQVPALGLGYRFVMDYKIDQLGIQGHAHGAILVEGWWYCPSMPQALIDATIDHRAGRIDLATYRTRFKERRSYRVRPKEGRDGTAFMCPAQGDHPTVTCPLKEKTEDKDGKAVPVRLGLPRVGRPPKRPPKICTTTRVTIDKTVGAKYRQELQYGTDEQHGIYTVLRNTIEGTNGTAKRASEQDLENPVRRPGRGIAATQLYVALVLFSENLRRIQRWAEHAEVEIDGTVVVKNPRKTKRKRPRPGEGFTPRAVVFPGDAEAPART